MANFYKVKLYIKNERGTFSKDALINIEKIEKITRNEDRSFVNIFINGEKHKIDLDSELYKTLNKEYNVDVTHL